MGPIKKLRARFYETSTGRNPVREWLLNIKGEDRRTIGYDIQTVEFGWPMGMPTCRPFGEGLWGVRSHLSDGAISRVIFFALPRATSRCCMAFSKRPRRRPSETST